MKKLMTLAAASACALAAAAPASAAIIISASAGPVQPGENVLSDTSMTALTVMGTTNQSNTLVSISSNETLTSTASNGQARFAAIDGTLDVGNIFLTAGGTFTLAEFNLFNAQGSTDSVAITINGVTRNFAIGNGQNFFGIQATGGDTITSIAFNANGTGVADLRQLRVGGITAAVPEPGTWALMLLGFGAVGASLRRRRRTTHLPQFG